MSKLIFNRIVPPSQVQGLIDQLKKSEITQGQILDAANNSLTHMGTDVAGHDEAYCLGVVIRNIFCEASVAAVEPSDVESPLLASLRDGIRGHEFGTSLKY